LAEKKEVRQAKLRAQHSQMKSTMNYYPGGFPVVYNAAPMARGAPYGQPMIRPARGYPTANTVPQRGAYQQSQQGAPIAQSSQGVPRGGVAPRGGRGGRSSGPTQQNQRGNNQQGNKSVRYNQNVRNQPQPTQNAQQVQPVKVVPQQVPVVQEVQPQADEISPEKLAQLPEEEQKRILGEQLYPLIYEKHQELAGKITGMLLDLDNGELLHYLEDRSALDARVLEAIAVLNESQNE